MHRIGSRNSSHISNLPLHTHPISTPSNNDVTSLPKTVLHDLLLEHPFTSDLMLCNRTITTPCLWNDLTSNLLTVSNSRIFHSKLKLHVFKHSYPERQRYSNNLLILWKQNLSILPNRLDHCRGWHHRPLIYEKNKQIAYLKTHSQDCNQTNASSIQIYTFIIKDYAEERYKLALDFIKLCYRLMHVVCVLHIKIRIYFISFNRWRKR